jgi:hypothetical protein
MSLKESKKSNRGGARANAGRPKGTTDRVTIAGLLAAIEDTTGKEYVDILAEDFAQARATDRNLTAKYHHLLASKLMNSLQTVEVVENGSEAEAKQAAFQEALAKLAYLNESNK